MKVSDSVYTTHNEKRDKGYTLDGINWRRNCNRLVGKIVDFHDSHGYCFEVEFPGGRKATYDPDELTVIEQAEWTPHPGVRMFRAEGWHNILGRGRTAVVDIGDGSLPKPGDPVRIDGEPYTIVGVESQGGKGPKVGLVVKERSVNPEVLNQIIPPTGALDTTPFFSVPESKFLDGKTPQQWIKEGVPCDGCYNGADGPDDPEYHEAIAEHYHDGSGKFLCDACYGHTPEALAKEAQAWLDGSATMEGWVDAPMAIPRIGESTPISIRLPSKMVAILKEFARRWGTPYQTMMKMWLDDRIRVERDKLIEKEKPHGDGR